MAEFNAKRDARRIVMEVLREAALSDDPALAAAAQAEITYRHERAVESFREVVRKLGESFQRAGALMASITPSIQRFYQQMQEAERESAVQAALEVAGGGAPAPAQGDPGRAGVRGAVTPRPERQGRPAQGHRGS